MVLSAFCGPDTLRKLLQKRLQELGLGLGRGVAVVAGRGLRAVSFTPPKRAKYETQEIRAVPAPTP